MPPPPPRSTLFPYTTLFRSGGDQVQHAIVIGLERLEDLLLELGEEPVVLHRDRKSTRLNSSHVKISYAVFCLKKKEHQHVVHLSRHDKALRHFEGVNEVCVS